MAKTKNTFIEGMDQDTSKSKYKNTKIYKGVNIKVLTDEGLSSGAIENEDGNKLSFSIPDTFPLYKIYFDDKENPSLGTLDFTYIDPTTGLTINTNSGNSSSIEELYENVTVALASLITANSVKVLTRGANVFIVCLDNKLSSVIGSGGLSGVDGTPLISAQTGLKIIGWSTLRNEIILFTTNETSATPSSAGQIWKFEYDPITKDVVGLTSGYLSLVDHYIYNGILDFSTYWHIGTETVGHYENSGIGRVYWTDEYNVLRTANVLDPELFSTNPSNFGMTEGINMSLPVVDRVTNGGSIPDGATVQYCYRLFTEGGQATTFSPITNPIPLGNFTPDSGNLNDVHWNAHGTNSGSGATKAIVYNINNIDTSFAIIEHIAVVNTSSGSDIYKFAEETIPADGTLTVTHSSRGLGITITPLEFVTLTRTFKKCKTITVKDKRLLAANLSTDDTSIDGFDSRAYRFNSSKVTVLTDSELLDISLTAATVNPPAYSSVPEEHDCINPYNKDESDVVDTSTATTATNQYKYKADGVTLGGEGLNISYEFSLQDIPIKAGVSGIAISTAGSAVNALYDINRVNRNNEAPINGYVSLNGENRGNIDEHQSFKSPTMTGAFKGYARGEVYRFAIVFYDTEGNPYNAKWIGDIKIPEAYENNGQFGIRDTTYINADFNVLYDNPLKARSIGINFTVDVSTIQDKISGFEIVRVERKQTDRTRLGTGLYANFDSSQGFNVWANRRSNYPTGAPSGIVDLPVLSIAGVSKNVKALVDRPNGAFDTHKTGSIIIPSLLADESHNWRTGDKLRTIGFYTDFEAASGSNSSGYESYRGLGAFPTVMGVNYYNVTPGQLASSLTLGYGWQPALANIANEQYTIDGYFPLLPGQEIEDTHPLNTLGSSIVNASMGSVRGASFNYSPAGIGDKKHIVKMSDNWKNYQYSNSHGSYINSQNTVQWREVSYNRSLISQYGGDTYEARSRNKYLSTGAFKRIGELSPSSNSIVVYGGDTTVHQFAYQYFHAWANGEYGQYSKDDIDAAYHLGLNFPCESYVNLDYQLDGCYGDLTTINYFIGPPLAAPYTNPNPFLPVPLTVLSMRGPKQYVVPSFYNDSNNVKNIYYPKDFIDNTVTEHPHRIWASERKLDGELLDSWKTWLPNNYTEVDGQYGQINKITTARDIFHFYQDTAFGAASVNDRAVINDEDGVSLTLGSGGILDDYGYISRNTGTRQKFSVVPTGMAIHHYDDILNKWVRYSDGPRPVSDIEGLHSTFRKFDGEFLKNDRTLLGKGIHGSFDKVRNKVYMTFLDAQQGINGVPNYDYTISYNENLQSFDSFSDCIPSMYLESHGKLLTINPELTAGYVQYEGEKNNFFGVVYPSVIEIILNPAQDMTAIFDNIEYKGEISIADIDQSNLTLDSIRVLNDHQDTGVIQLVPDGNIRRKFRSWRTTFPRDINSPNGDARMRDYFVKLILTHTPNSNERMVLHDIQYEFRISSH